MKHQLFVRENAGEYRQASKAEILKGAQDVARLQHLKPSIQTASAFIDYLRLNMMLLPTEQLRVFYLNNENRIMQEEILSEGIEDQTAVYPKNIIRKALLGYATGVLVVHNHPAGQLRPSNADIVITKAIARAADIMDIRFIDHVIIAGGEVGYFSFRENGLL